MPGLYVYINSLTFLSVYSLYVVYLHHNPFLPSLDHMRMRSDWSRHPCMFHVHMGREHRVRTGRTAVPRLSLDVENTKSTKSIIIG